MDSPVIVRAVQTCHACPSQWDAWDEDGQYWYLRYRSGRGTAEKQPGSMEWSMKTEPEFSFQYGDALDGIISLEEFCQRAGITLALGKER